MKRRDFPLFNDKRGICGVCEKACPLTTDGLLQKHSVILYAPPCEGSFTEPTRIVEWRKKSDD